MRHRWEELRQTGRLLGVQPRSDVPGDKEEKLREELRLAQTWRSEVSVALPLEIWKQGRQTIREGDT